MKHSVSESWRVMEQTDGPSSGDKFSERIPEKHKVRTVNHIQATGAIRERQKTAREARERNNFIVIGQFVRIQSANRSYGRMMGTFTK